MSNYQQQNIPVSIEAEEAVLGCILLDSGAIKRIANMLLNEHFSLMAHQAIFDVALYLHRKNETVDLMSVTQRLAATNQLTGIGGTAKLAQLVNRTVSAVNVDRYAQLMIKKYRRRKLIEIGYTLVNLGSDEQLDLEEVESQVCQKFEEWLKPSGEITRINQPVEVNYQHSITTTQKADNKDGQELTEDICTTEAVTLKTMTNSVSEITELVTELNQRAKDSIKGKQ